MVLLDVVVGFRINGNGFGKPVFQGGDEMLFPAVKKLGNFRMYFYREPVAHDIPGFGDQVSVNFMADGFSG